MMVSNADQVAWSPEAFTFVTAKKDPVPDYGAILYSESFDYAGSLNDGDPLNEIGGWTIDDDATVFNDIGYSHPGRGRTEGGSMLFGSISDADNAYVGFDATGVDEDRYELWFCVMIHGNAHLNY